MRALLSGVPTTPQWADATVTGVAYDSRAVSVGDAFFCVPGFAHDGHDYAADAAGRGAAALVVERLLPGIDLPQVVVADARVALAEAASVFFERPSSTLQVVGITGTNGKTTCTYLLDSILRASGRTTGLIGTVETRIAGVRQRSARTTPESSDLQELFATMRDEGVAAVSMEVSSHAIDLHRVDATSFAAVAFTNLTQDHLDYHHTIEEYFLVKRRLFTDFEVGARVVNVDDPLGEDLAREIPGVTTVGRSPSAAVRATGERLSVDHSHFTLRSELGDFEIDLPLTGGYNIENAIVAAGCALRLGVAPEAVVQGLGSAPQVPGRLERVDCGQDFAVVVDYAHTPDSLGKATRALAAVTTGRVILVFGCGGDRDPEKRALMGEAAGLTADFTVLTSDNPRSEDPVGIILQVEDGVKTTGARYEVEVDRRRAIARALELAAPGDCVLIAGKGHEDYQIFADRTIHFDDREVVREELGAPC